ncbi:MAG: PhzF family phenazine biosynthesis protein [Parasphingopyxis sp.]|uniref:PhzF family phenazine biosynthesis protein n=1 Tax=Parasphingopyxis sp. TaxID=1920299 RepID=UPI003F9F1B98
MAETRSFKQVDVFTAVPLLGNPVAVVLDADGMDTAAMQRFAAWTNLSETTFVLPPSADGADYRVRIFTPRSEMPFAGHPTIGTAHAVLEAGIAEAREGRLVQQCKVGLVDLAVAGDWRREGLSFRLPPHHVEPAPEPEDLRAIIGAAAALRGPPMAVNVGPTWMIAELAEAEAVERLQPDLQRLAAYSLRHARAGLTVFAVRPDGEAVVRSFAPADLTMEDPVCGSGNGAVAAYRFEDGQIAAGDSYRASQGRQVGRDGRVAIRVDEHGIHVGGVAVTCIEGTLRL